MSRSSRHYRPISARPPRSRAATLIHPHPLILVLILLLAVAIVAWSVSHDAASHPVATSSAGILALLMVPIVRG